MGCKFNALFIATKLLFETIEDQGLLGEIFGGSYAQQSVFQAGMFHGVFFFFLSFALQSKRSYSSSSCAAAVRMCSEPFQLLLAAAVIIHVCVG